MSPRSLRNSGLLRCAGAVESDVDDAFDAARARRHDDDAIAHVDGFVDVMGDEQHGGAARLPKAEDFVLHAHAGEGVERAERFIEQQNFGMIDQRAGQSDALGHAAGEMMRIGIGESFEADQAHEFVDFMALFVQQAASDQARLECSAGRSATGKDWGPERPGRVRRLAR